MIYDYLIVGAGLFGSTFAYCATCSGKKCLVIDINDHIGGNCYTKKQEDIHVHVHGPHIFHTSDKRIWDFVNEFAKFNSYTHRVKAISNNKIYSLPINLLTMHQVFGSCTPIEAISLLEKEKIHCSNPRNLEEWALSQVGRRLYDLLIYGYTRKQWGQEPATLPASIIKRLPIRTTMDDNYFNDIYQGIPIGGYTQIFEMLLEGSDVMLSTDFFKNRKNLEKLGNRIVYTGKIDQYYDYAFGKLGYRTLRFENKVFDTENYQGLAQLNYTSLDVPWTRTIEHRHFDNTTKSSKTIVTWEYPEKFTDNSPAYYPVNDLENSNIYSKYKELSLKEDKTIFGGRLATYQYKDMHQIIASAMHLAKKEKIFSIL